MKIKHIAVTIIAILGLLGAGSSLNTYADDGVSRTPSQQSAHDSWIEGQDDTAEQNGQISKSEDQTEDNALNADKAKQQNAESGTNSSSHVNNQTNTNDNSNTNDKANTSNQGSNGKTSDDNKSTQKINHNTKAHEAKSESKAKADENHKHVQKHHHHNDYLGIGAVIFIVVIIIGALVHVFKYKPKH